MKTTHKSDYKSSADLNTLINVFSSRDLIEEKKRITLYVPKGIVQLLDELAKDKSRGEIVTSLVLKESRERQKTPYGMFSGEEISEEEIEKVISQWDEAVDELT